MAESIELQEFSNAYDEVETLKDLETILNDSTYNVSMDQIKTKYKSKDRLEELKKQMANEDFQKLKSLLDPEIDQDLIALHTYDLRKRLVSKKNELYLRVPNSKKAPTVKFGNSKWKAIQITYSEGKTLYALKTLIDKGLSNDDSLYKLLSEKGKNKQIESTETLRKTVASAHNMVTSTPISKSKSVIQEPVRPLLESAELNNILTQNDRNLITTYLDFVERNITKIADLERDIEFNQKEIAKAENQLKTETNEDDKAILQATISKSKANIITSKQMIDQIKAYEKTQYTNVDVMLKSKFTMAEKLKYIIKKYGLTIAGISLAIGLVIDTIIINLRGTPSPSPAGNNNFPDKVKQSLKNFANWLADMSKKALDHLPAIIGQIISFLLKTTASIVGFLAEHLILFVIALAFALYEAIMIGYNDIKRRK